MKKNLLAALLLLMTTCVFAQKNVQNSDIQKRADSVGQGGNNEIKLNLLNTVLGLAEVNYERIIADNQGFGLAAAVSLTDKAVYDERYNFALTPYYRVYFGKQKANGFFIEANASVISVDIPQYYFDSNNYTINESENKTYTNFGLGVAAGFKFLTRNGIIGELFLGGGRLLGNDTFSGGYPRLGISLGKRF
ncbi:hypothetical protein [Pedobacter sp. SL55]|uniref:hypothetical protein n=1 Tax=Pedobacter sp. SL55 TaxID=2995161 RepID=UPI002270EB79|nr:hypothetical protein [Pedobacter sp. SL55]WAC40251.1 hypothetical protein OVA16_17000 [Pedobacter sp. SL55]